MSYDLPHLPAPEAHRAQTHRRPHPARHHRTRTPVNLSPPPWAYASAVLLAMTLIVGLCEWIWHTIKKGRR